MRHWTTGGFFSWPWSSLCEHIPADPRLLLRQIRVCICCLEKLNLVAFASMFNSTKQIRCFSPPPPSVDLYWISAGLTYMSAPPEQTGRFYQAKRRSCRGCQQRATRTTKKENVQAFQLISSSFFQSFLPDLLTINLASSFTGKLSFSWLIWHKTQVMSRNNVQRHLIFNRTKKNVIKISHL